MCYLNVWNPQQPLKMMLLKVLKDMGVGRGLGSHPKAAGFVLLAFPGQSPPDNESTSGAQVYPENTSSSTCPHLSVDFCVTRYKETFLSN